MRKVLEGDQHLARIRRKHKDGGHHSSVLKRKIKIASLLGIAVLVVGYLVYSNSGLLKTDEPKSTIAAGASTSNIGLEVGDLSPSFQLKDIEGRIVTRENLGGKPTMIFFTTTWCVPCQVGAKELLKYYQETGNDAFSVVIVFVDPKETNDQIEQWKRDFGASSWFTALDTAGMANGYQVRYLDTKYVLDRNGIIVWKDFYPLSYDTAKKVLQPLIG